MASYIPDISPLIPNQSLGNNENTEKNTDKNDLIVRQKCICPFRLQWSFGINPEVPVINLTTENRTLVAYACSHVVIIYDYSSRKMLPLQGHQNAVRTLSISKDGKWLLTADFEKNYAIVVWDIEKRTPVYTKLNPHRNDGMTAARISSNAKQIVTVGNGRCQNVYFWLWTYGRAEPDATFSLTDTMSERVKEIAFNDERPEQFVLTTDSHVLFLTWNGQALKYDHPKVMRKFRRLGIFNGSCYVPQIQQVLTITTIGCVLVWNEDKRTIDNHEKKKHLQTVNLQKSNITVIVDCDGMLIMGNANGRITIYDYRLRLLYWYQNNDLDSIRWLSFNLRCNMLTPEKSERFASDEEIKMSEGSSEFNMNIVHVNSRRYKSTNEAVNKTELNRLPMDISLRCFPSNIRNFLVCSSTGIIALIDTFEQKCHSILRYPVATATCLDTHPKSNYIVVGDSHGTVHLYNHEECILTISRNMPSLPDFLPIMEEQTINKKIIYVTCPKTHENLKAITALKFSPKCDMLASGLENGAVWILHHITLEPLDDTPYKHSSAAINKIIFTQCADYMAYADNALTVVVFKRNDTVYSKERNLWNLIGKYQSHCLPIRDILFGPSDSNLSRLFSLGEDRELIEYDLEHSGPYPVPGLKILQINRIEESAIPFRLAWYPESGVEKFLIISNSEYKYKIFNDITKTIRGTYLGPTFGEPVQHIQVLTDKLVNNNGYMLFATDKEIGIQVLPLDGNPYKIVCMIGHPEKITAISISGNKQFMFTIGYNDPCVLMWKIILSSTDKMTQLGGEELLPFLCLIEGGGKGWLINEMKDLFYYAQILHQGDYTTNARIASDTVVIEQIPNLMRAIGYYPNNKEIENIMKEIYYKYYEETGTLTEEINFKEFVRLYINHRPAFGLSMHQIKKAFRIFMEENYRSVKNCALTREQFLNVLLGGRILETSLEEYKSIGEPLTLQEAYTYLRLLVSSDEEPMRTYQLSPSSQRPTPSDFHFLPSRISYKDFVVDIMGIELSEDN